MDFSNSNKEFFDESIFTHLFASTIHGAKLIIAENEADQWLAKKFSQVPVVDKCIDHSERININGPVINLNPKQTCYGKAIYTLDPIEKEIGFITNFNPVNIFQGSTNDKLEIKDYVDNLIYDLNNNLNSVNSAIMIKYYANNNNNVTITKNLFRFIEHHFINDERFVFNPRSFGIVQDENGILKDENGKIITTYVTNYFAPPIELIKRFKGKMK